MEFQTWSLGRCRRAARRRRNQTQLFIGGCYFDKHLKNAVLRYRYRIPEFGFLEALILSLGVLESPPIVARLFVVGQASNFPRFFAGPFELECHTFPRKPGGTEEQNNLSADRWLQ